MKEYLSFEESAQWLTERGIDVTERTLRRWHANGKIETFSLGKTVRVPVASLERLIKQNTGYQK